ncbi:carboxypeptidase-like regulatory domain-containing protein [Mucilaginibacter sp.]|uniref:carboxypeptidase-like regulatory domain-containing protein n=1 Tax=Mucilaginibacter sp. TaxID=1882438 RepID=UPI002846A6FA|nr:carboxypeptidase-like regulatory domain-containing protein [Mucilaginibacter sp.]MDR3693565.1 carboxypeptidase-like regulatory domain-containing protein [Mucilaginibacter sp.]
MRFPWLILMYLVFPFVALAQNGTITGVVTTVEGKKPLARASVFLSNSSAGTATADNGTFALYNVRPGQYTLVVRILGYETYSKTVLVGAEPIKLDIQLAQKPLMLREVDISSASDWKKNFEAFKKDFIGKDENAKYCEIMNPHILNLAFNQTKKILTASTDQFLIIENKALGYRVKFLVDSFSVDHINEVVSTSGSQVFEELPGSDAQKKKWHERREAAYHGSAMHFYRSLITDKVMQEGFIMYHFLRYVNPLRPPDEVIRHKVKVFVDHHMIDSARYYVDVVSKYSKYYNEKILKPQLFTFEVFSNGSQPGLYTIHFPKYLYVVYTKKTDDTPDINLYRALDQPNYAVSIITLNSDYAEFDHNGILVGGSTLYEGEWATHRLSDMLPVDYVPDENK